MWRQKSDGSLERVAVTLGVSDSVQTEIQEGLSQGDRVVTGTKLVSASGKMPDPNKMQQQPGGNNNPFMPRPPRDDNNNKRTE